MDVAGYDPVDFINGCVYLLIPGVEYPGDGGEGRWAGNGTGVMEFVASILLAIDEDFAVAQCEFHVFHGGDLG